MPGGVQEGGEQAWCEEFVGVPVRERFWQAAGLGGGGVQEVGVGPGGGLQF